MKTGRVLAFIITVAMLVSMSCTVPEPTDAEVSETTNIPGYMMPFLNIAGYGGPPATLPSPLDPDTVVVTGDICLTSDVAMEDHSNILVENGTVIDLNGHSLNLGSGTTVYLRGTVTLNGDSDSHLVIGAGTDITGEDIKFYPPENTMDYCIDGSLSVSMHHDLQAYYCDSSFTPSAEGGTISAVSIHPSSGTEYRSYISTFQASFRVSSLSIIAFKASPDHMKFIDGLGLTVEFEITGFTKTTTDDGGYGTVRDICLYADTSVSPTISMSTEGGIIRFEEINIKNFGTGSYDEKNQISRNLLVHDLDSPEIFINDSHKLHIACGAGGLTFEEKCTGVQTYHAEMTDVRLEAVWAIDTLLSSTDTPDLERMLRSLDNATFSAGEVRAYSSDQDNPLVMTDTSVSLVKNDSGSYFLHISFSTDGKVVEITASDADVDRFSLNDSLVLDLEVDIGNVVITIAEEDVRERITLEHCWLIVDSMDIRVLRDRYADNSRITLQDLIDTCGYITEEIESASIDNGDDGSTDAVAIMVSLDLRKDRKGLSIASLEIDSFKGTVIHDGTPISLDTAHTTVIFESDHSVSSISTDDGSDNHLKITLGTARLWIEYPYDYEGVSGTLTFDTSKRGQYYSTDSVCLEFQINYTAATSETHIKSRYDFTEYNAEISISSVFDKPEGSSKIVLRTSDLIGSSNMAFVPNGTGSTLLRFNATIDSSLNLDVYYYGISFQINGKNISFKLNESCIDITAYDYRTEGIGCAFRKIMENSYKAEISGLLTMNQATLDNHNDNLHREFSDLLIKFGNIEIEKVSGDYRRTVVDDTLISSKVAGKMDINRSINDFVTTQDLNPPEDPTKTITDPSHHTIPALTIMLALCIISLMLVCVPHWYCKYRL